MQNTQDAINKYKHYVFALKDNAKENILIGAFFLTGIVLMYFGYFTSGAEGSIILYISLMSLWTVAYAVIFGYFVKPVFALYSWFFFFLFFPKKSLNFKFQDVLFAKAFGVENHIIFSVYEVFELGLIAALVIILIRQKRFLHKDFISVSLIVIFISGALHIAFADELKIVNYQGMMPIVIGYVIYNYTKRIDYSQINVIFDMFIALALFLFAEYALGRAQVLPDSINYYIFNYRNAFRSILVSGDLTVGLLLIAAAFISLYRYFKSKNIFYAVLFLICNYLIFETFYRTTTLALLLSACLVGIYLKYWLRTVLYVLILIFVLMPIANQLSKMEVSIRNAERKIIGEKMVNFNTGRSGGYLATDSLTDRFSLQVRVLDVLRYTNFLGSGPGESPAYIDNSDIPFHGQNLKIMSFDNTGKFYQSIMAGKHRTNSHMLLTHFLVEFGPAAILFPLALAVFLFRSLVYLFRNRQSASLLLVVSTGMLLAYAMYYTLQVTPLILGVVMLFVNISKSEAEIFIDKKHCDYLLLT